ncbi:hypothetical protein FSARC_6648 [Fusarium sarcochroum]|uniref:Lignostilbene dioxygenase n=1 Tax=Fusarium sarcochroum TaxID=1208366 RepID=A0A8H4TWQ4_9HYPO|nr:hypothetical protein FSARC_6648 [Fusarium sarcochroum]
MSGHYRGISSKPTKAFPSEPQFSGFMKPCRFEGEINFLEVEGDLPQELDGTFYRVMPDPQFPPMDDNDPWFNGDGNISAFRFTNGNVHFLQRYVHTEKFLREREAQQSLAGKYRNKYTDAVEFKIRTTANTNIFYFNKVLLAIKEDAPPFAMDPITLETFGLHNFNGQLPSLTFTAHPKLDPRTGELVCFGYEAKGDGTPDICYYTIDPDGTFTQVVWLVSPVVGMIHDFAVTENWMAYVTTSVGQSMDRFIYSFVSFSADVFFSQWFKAPNSFPGHTANAYETSDGKVVFDLPLTDKNVFFWWPDQDGNAPDPHDIHAKYVRFTFDPTSTDLDLPDHEVIAECDMEFPRIDDRVSMRPHRHSFFDMMDPKLGTDFAAISPVMGGGHALYNSLGHLDHQTGNLDVYFPGKTHMVQEPVFVARSDHAPEGDGFVIVLINNYSTMSSELHIVDTHDFSTPRAVVKLNIRLRAGLHGNWVDGKEISR